MPIHHATIAKAAKIGVILSQVPDSDRIMAHWTERNRRAYAANSAGAPALVDDIAKLRMLVLEYPHLKVEQPNLKQGDYSWTISLRGDVIGEDERLADAWDAALDVLEGSEDDTDDFVADEDRGDSDEDDKGKSVVKRKYKTAYKPFKQTCGDELSQLITRHLRTLKDPDTGRMRIDPDKLRKFAKANGVWDDKYAKLNVGMRRMTIGVRLRGRVKKDKDFQIAWV